jgi:hypothetical protein
MLEFLRGHTAICMLRGDDIHEIGPGPKLYRYYRHCRDVKFQSVRQMRIDVQ